MYLQLIHVNTIDSIRIGVNRCIWFLCIYSDVTHCNYNKKFQGINLLNKALTFNSCTFKVFI